MQTKEYRTIDKSSWPAGPWQDEFDKKQFEDADTGLPCLIVRNAGGALCGYVGVPEGHPAFEKDYNDIYMLDDDIRVHGGMTFSDFCAQGDNECTGICHVPGPGESDRVWWFGFDCNHGGDIAPAWLNSDLPQIPDIYGSNHYRDVPYVETDIRHLAARLHRMAAV